MIEATTLDVREAYLALRRMNEETRLPEKAAWPVSRLMGKLKRAARDAEEDERTLFENAGAVADGQRMTMRGPERRQDESDEEFNARLAEHLANLRSLQAAQRAANQELVQIDCEPLRRSVFADAEGTKPEKLRLFSANDFLDAGPFIIDG